MSVPPPPAPPPPPPNAGLMLPSAAINALFTFCSNCSYEELLKEVEEEGQRELFSLSSGGVSCDQGNFDKRLLLLFRPLLKPLLQGGPVCGIVSLVEAAQLVGVDLSPEATLQTAVNLHLSKSGEIFSAESMRKLAEEVLKDSSPHLTTLSSQDVDLAEKLYECLVEKQGAVLIPYDADRNHRPTLREGHAAHWAVLHGLAILLPTAQLPKETSHPWTQLDKSVLLLNVERDFDELAILKNFLRQTLREDSLESGSLFVVAHQGKSSRSAIWPLQTLLNSNLNLKESAPKLTQNKFHIGNVQELAGKLILLHL